MAPAQLGKWLVLFCDEINLPDLDQYGKNSHFYHMLCVKACPHWRANPGSTQVELGLIVSALDQQRSGFGESGLSQPTYVCGLNWVETGFALAPPRVRALEKFPERSSATERLTLSRSSRASAINATLDCCIDLTRIDPGRVRTRANRVQPG